MREMGSDEFGEWIAYHTLEPFGQEREDFRAGVVASAAAAPHVKKGASVPGPLDWFKEFYAACGRAGGAGRPRRRMTAAEMRDRMRAVTLAMGGTVNGPAKG